jgi:hypothetical protein
MRTILPSWTATTGEPALAKMRMPRRALTLSTGTAALSPRLTRVRAWLAVRPSA